MVGLVESMVAAGRAATSYLTTHTPPHNTMLFELLKLSEPNGEKWSYYLYWAGDHLDGFVQDCCNSSALAMELPQSCIKPSINSTCLATHTPLHDIVCRFSIGPIGITDQTGEGQGPMKTSSIPCYGPIKYTWCMCWTEETTSTTTHLTKKALLLQRKVFFFFKRKMTSSIVTNDE